MVEPKCCSLVSMSCSGNNGVHDLAYSIYIMNICDFGILQYINQNIFLNLVFICVYTFCDKLIVQMYNANIIYKLYKY